MPIDLDKAGVPLYAGNPEDYDEYSERCWDFYFGMKVEDRTTVGIRLRGGLSGKAYECARKIAHESLQSEAGLKGLLQALDAGIHKEKPVRVTELCNATFYHTTVWRASGEEMSSFIERRTREFADLEKVSEATQVSDDIMAHILLNAEKA